MAAKLEEITLTFEHECVRFEDSGVAILDCVEPERETSQQNKQEVVESIEPAWMRKQVKVKAECEPTDFVRGLDYRFYGRWVNHEKYGRQFFAKTFIRTAPHGRAGTIRYLQQAPHIGRASALQLWDKFAGDAVRIVREDPEVASAAIGGQFNLERAAEASAYFVQEQAIEATTIDLMDLLDGRGFPKSTGKKCVAEWGNTAAELIRRNPYLLMRFKGCGFLRCDQLYLDLGGDPAKLKRQALCAWHAIAKDTSGNTWFEPGHVERGLRDRIGGTTVRAVDAVRLAVRGKLLATYRDGAGKLWFAQAGKAGNEQVIANRVHGWFDEPVKWPGVSTLDVSDHQRQIASEALMCPISIISGGPGTGKTFLSARIVAEIINVFGDGQVAVAAPTGKAAVRISEAMNGYGISLRAKTIHSLLGVESHSEGDGWGFKHNQGNPLPFKFIVVDESSMIDTDLAAAFFRACGVGTHVLLVGDIGQLPPVGHGAPLRDLIAAGVPSGELTEIRRNSGRIVQSCHEIRTGSTFGVSAEIDPDNGENLKVLPSVNAKSAIEKIVATIRAIGNRGLANPIWGCQVIVAVNDKSELSRRSVNLKLQAELNPGGKRAASNPFRVGDKIVCLKNSFVPVVDDAPDDFNQESEDKKVFVANGEQAAVKHVESKFTIAQLDSPARLVLIPRGGDASSRDGGSGGSGGTGCDWDLAYGISCHKSQGSEWPIVFVVLDEYPGAKMVCSKEWIYTALSRAKTACFMVGKLATAYGMVQRNAISKRKTFLKELIKS